MLGQNTTIIIGVELRKLYKLWRRQLKLSHVVLLSDETLIFILIIAFLQERGQE